MKAKTRFLSLILVLLLVIPTGAGAASYYDLYGPGAVRNDHVSKLGTLEMFLDSGRLKTGDSAIFSLPSHFEFRQSGEEIMSDADWELYQNGNSVRVGNDSNYFEFPALINGDPNALYNEDAEPFSVEQLSENEILFTVNTELDSSISCYFKLNLGQIYVPKDYLGEINISLEVNGDSGFISIVGNDYDATAESHPTLNPTETKPEEVATAPVQAANPEEDAQPLKEEPAGLWAKLQNILEAML